MSVNTIGNMISIKSGLNNLQLQQMTMASKSLSLINQMTKFKEEKRTASARKLLGDLQRGNAIIDELKKMDYDSLSPEERVAIEEGKKYEAQKIAAKIPSPGRSRFCRANATNW